MMGASEIDTEDNLRVIFDDAAIDDLLLAAEISGSVATHQDAVRAGDLLAEMEAAKVLLALLGRLQKPARALILQNRDRGTPAMIAQMNQIASGPDYYRVAPTKEFASGTPIVFGNDNMLPSGAVIGRKDKAVSADGQRFPVRYAVVEAADLLTSNKADGTAIDAYAGGMHGKLRAIAGNGRLAGLIASFDRDTAADYVRELAEDDAHGIAPDAIAKFKQPVLVRVMNQEDVTENIGDISNQRGTSDLSPVEQAQNDSKRLDLSELDIADDGKPSEAAARAFIAAMPESERNNLMDGKNPSQKAYDRLMATVFWKAYGDAELVRLYAQSVDPEVKTILGGMASASGDLAKLAGAGELDIRSVITEAAGLAVNAKRQGVKLSLFAQQADMTLSTDTMDVVRMFAENSRSAKKIGERLRAVARFAFDEFTKEDNDMFGPVEKASRAQVLAHLETPVEAPEVSLFDAIDPMLELELSGKLVARTAALAEAGEDNPMAVVTISGEIIAIIQQLQDADVPDAPTTDVDSQMESQKFRAQNDPAFKRLTSDFRRSLAVIIGIDNGTERGYDRALFVNSIVGKIKTQAKNDPDMAALLLAWLSVAQSKFAKPAITERNGVWAVVPEGWQRYMALFQPLGTGTTTPAAAAPVEAAISELERALDVAENNEPINRENGNVAQANLEAETADSLKAAIEVLSEAAIDITYRAVDDMFTVFYPNTKAGEEAWKIIAADDGTGKVLTAHAESVISQLREKGYTVAKAKNVAVDEDALLNALAAEPTPEVKPEVTEAEGRAALAKLKPFMSKGQRAAIAEGMNGEEAQFFFDKMAEMAAMIGKMHKTYDQDGLGNKAIVTLHYFRGNSDWYITEKDMTGNGTEQAFGYAILNGDRQNAELGYISIEELVSRNVELDLHWEKRTLAMVKSAMNEADDIAAATPAAPADPVAAMLAQAVADPIAHEAWTLPKEEIKAMPEADCKTILEKLIDANLHVESLVFMAARTGTAKQYETAKIIFRDGLKIGYLPPALSKRADDLRAELGMTDPAAIQEPVPAPPPPPEPAPGSYDVPMQNLISIAADSIEQLRRVDVYRVLNSAHNQREALATYIIENRPDLQREVLDVMAEEWPDLGYSAPAAPVVAETTVVVELPDPSAIVATLPNPGAPQPLEVPPVPEAAPAPTPAADPQRAADMDFLQSVISQSIDMWDDDLADKIEKLGAVYAGDADMEAAWGDAIKAYTDFMVDAMSKP